MNKKKTNPQKVIDDVQFYKRYEGINVISSKYIKIALTTKLPTQWQKINFGKAIKWPVKLPK
jgi:hypothetical protein